MSDASQMPLFEAASVMGLSEFGSSALCADECCGRRQPPGLELGAGLAI